MWALGYGVANAPTRGVAARLRARCSIARWPRSNRSSTSRSRAYAMLGFAHALRAHDDDRSTPTRCGISRRAPRTRYDASADDEWPWFEDAMTYDNARLPEAMLRAGSVLDEPRVTPRSGSARWRSTKA